ncbi:MAG: hypothetical protein ACLT8H_10030 [Streptococcus parasanguinis]
MPNIVNSNHPIKIYLVANDKASIIINDSSNFFAGLVVFSSCAVFINIAQNFILHIALLIFLSLFVFLVICYFFTSGGLQSEVNLLERIYLNRENDKEKNDAILTGFALAHWWDLALYTLFN